MVNLVDGETTGSQIVRRNLAKRWSASNFYIKVPQYGTLELQCQASLSYTQLQIIRDFLRQWGAPILAGWRTVAKQEKAFRYELDVKWQTLVTEKKGGRGGGGGTSDYRGRKSLESACLLMLCGVLGPKNTFATSPRTFNFFPASKGAVVQCPPAGHKVDSGFCTICAYIYVENFNADRSMLNF